jgi:hypothetical protein
MNLLKETLLVMNQHGKTPGDVIDVQWDVVTVQRDKCGRVTGTVTNTFGTSWSRFASAIGGLEYDNGYGTHEIINGSLKVVFSGMSWLERTEYDGAEHWEYKQCPKPITNAVVDIKDILRATLENPCSHCANDTHEPRRICSTCDRNYSNWEMK